MSRKRVVAATAAAGIAVSAFWLSVWGLGGGSGPELRQEQARPKQSSRTR